MPADLVQADLEVAERLERDAAKGGNAQIPVELPDDMTNSVQTLWTWRSPERGAVRQFFTVGQDFWFLPPRLPGRSTQVKYTVCSGRQC